MTKEEFIKKAKELGYDDESISLIIGDIEESGIKYEDFILIKQASF